jgi:hypothetical protein
VRAARRAKPVSRRARLTRTGGARTTGPERFSRVADLDVRYLPYSELEKHREAIARFGIGLKGIEAIARRLV